VLAGQNQPARLLAIAAAIEAVTGLALIAAPSIFTQLLLGESVAGVGAIIGRVAGLGLLALGIAAWPGRARNDSPIQALLGLVTYNGLASLYLLYIAVGTQLVGALLWPAFALHAVITLMLARAWLFRPAGNIFRSP
jgi:hypothetical protein